MEITDRKAEPTLNREFAEYIKKRFSGINLKMHVSTEEVDWIFAKINHKGGFYRNGHGNLKFFVEMYFNEKNGLGEKIAKNVHTGNEIDKSSNYMGRPHRTYTNNSYIAICNIKREPKNTNNLFNNIFGYLMRKPYEQLLPILA